MRSTSRSRRAWAGNGRQRMGLPSSSSGQVDSQRTLQTGHWRSSSQSPTSTTAQRRTASSSRRDQEGRALQPQAASLAGSGTVEAYSKALYSRAFMTSGESTSVIDTLQERGFVAQV